ncbi:hypothetical protein [Candidatus Viridilinea mediisalina]|nr:hypothetical protein [Candidatus Viridilinea mediisalina]
MGCLKLNVGAKKLWVGGRLYRRSADFSRHPGVVGDLSRLKSALPMA